MAQAVNLSPVVGIGGPSGGVDANVTRSVTLSVEGMHCGGCMRKIERTLQDMPGVAVARANLSARRVTAWVSAREPTTEALVTALDGVGFRAAELTDADGDAGPRRDRDLLRRVGVAGFAAANVMLLSVSVWAGLASDMPPVVQSLFHWLSALIALPAIAYAAQPFFRSAVSALSARSLNMDVPISLGILLATGLSLFQTMRGGEHVYFDAAITLTFFLLIGRLLDESMRVRARGAAANLLSLKALTATVIAPDGTQHRVAARGLEPGMRVRVAAGERIPVDGCIVAGQSDVDESLITGESVPRTVAVGAPVNAGTLNLGGSLEIEATAADDSTLLAELARLMAAAEQGQGAYVRLADRAAKIYAPAVHLLGAATLAGWLVAGYGFVDALTAAIAVLIITCPCALALAVPAVQVAATSRLFARGVIVKSADALERLAEVDTVVLDKTGTLTHGEPQLVAGGTVSDALLAEAMGLAAVSRHPYARAIVRAAEARGLAVVPRAGVVEVPGCGLSAQTEAGELRLGSGDWVGAGAAAQADGQTSVYLGSGGRVIAAFAFSDTLRSDAREAVNTLMSAGYATSMLSGDRPEIVVRVAESVGIADHRGSVRPDAKLQRIEALRGAGARVLMIGDGLNDAPALAAGHASMSPSSAADISQTAADVVFQGGVLAPVVETLAVARRARRMALENFAIALGYNAVFVPLAVVGLVTPLLAAIAMSASSIAVTANALRLRSLRLGPPTAPQRRQEVSQ